MDWDPNLGGEGGQAAGTPCYSGVCLGLDTWIHCSRTVIVAVSSFLSDPGFPTPHVYATIMPPGEPVAIACRSHHLVGLGPPRP